MKNLTYENFRIFGLYVYNRVDYNKFKKLFEKVFNEHNEHYIESKWLEFNSEPLEFVMKLNSEEFFNLIVEEINKSNYKG
jgi:hypothetical protein